MGEHVEIEITPYCIRNGLKESCEHCPIALAIYLAFEPKSIDVNSTTAKWKDNDFAYECDLPTSARNFISAFDQGLYVFPFTLHGDVRKSKLHTPEEEQNG